MTSLSTSRALFEESRHLRHQECDRHGECEWASSERIVAVETTDKLTDPQIVAKAKEHYGIAR